MRKVFFLLIFLAIKSHAVTYTAWSVDYASYVPTAEVAVNVSTGGIFASSGTPGDVISWIFVGRCGGAGSQIELYDGQTSTAAGRQLFVIDTSSTTGTATANQCPALGLHPFFIPVSSGITYAVRGAVVPQWTLGWDNNDE